MKHKDYVNDLVDALGGAKNVSSVAHCATRLRFLIVDKSKIDKTRIENLEQTVGIMEAQGTFQIIVGTHVGDVYNELVKINGIKDDIALKDDDVDLSKQSKVDRFLSTISAIFTPYIPVLASAGIIKGLLALCVNRGWILETANTYSILSAAGNSLIYFFPILLAFTAAKKFGANEFIGAVIGAALMEPNLTAINITGSKIDFLGISFTAQSFENTVLPIIIGMWVYSLLEKFLKKVLPKAAQLMLVPLISLIVMVPAMLLVFGPVGFAVANGIANVYQMMLDLSPIFMGIVFGGFFIYVIMLGMHWVILPIQLSILAEKGQEFSLASGGLGNYALLGVCLAVLFTSKDKQSKSMAGSAAFVNFLSGITEPGLYGVALKNKKYLIAISIAGITGGVISGAAGVYVTNFAFSGLFGLPAFMSMPKAPIYFVSVGVTIAVAFVLTLILEKSTKKTNEDDKNQLNENKNVDKKENIITKIDIRNPVKGNVIDLNKVSDPAFAVGALGDGVGIYPKDNKVYAPVDGEITCLFESKHAIGITTESGAELLIHIGINTVTLEGKYFKNFVKQGDKVKKGEKLIEFQYDNIVDEGLDPTVMVVVTNIDKFKGIDIISKGITEVDKPLFSII